jgi:hypothetical protein
MRSVFTKERTAPLCATLVNENDVEPERRRQAPTLHGVFLGVLCVMRAGGISTTSHAKSAKVAKKDRFTVASHACGPARERAALGVKKRVLMRSISTKERTAPLCATLETSSRCYSVKAESSRAPWFLSARFARCDRSAPWAVQFHGSVCR